MDEKTVSPCSQNTDRFITGTKITVFVVNFMACFIFLLILFLLNAFKICVTVYIVL